MLSTKPETADFTNSSALPSEEYARKALPSILTTFDLTAIFIITVFYITNAFTAAVYGPTAYIYWVVGGITFFLPSIIATAQLGAMFPHEGSLYNWTHKILGPYWGFFAGVCWWFPAPLILVSAAVSMVTYIQGMNSNWLTQPWQQGLVIIGVTAFSGIVGFQRARTAQNIINVGAVLIIFATLMLGVATLIWFLTGHTSATSFVHASDYGVNGSNLGGYALVVLAYLGTQVPLNMGGEIAGNNQRRGRLAISRHLLWGSLIVVIGYLIATTAPLVVLGPAKVATAGPFALIATIDTVFSKGIGNIVAICIMLFFPISAVAYNVTFARVLFAGSVDRHLPVSAGLLNKNRVPANAILFQTLISVAFAAVVFLIAPYIVKFDNPVNLSQEYFNVSMAVVAIVWGLITIFFYINLVQLYRRNRQFFLERLIFPMPVIWFSCIVGPIGCLVTIADGIYNSWTPLISNVLWLIIVGGLVLTCLTFVAIGSMLATSEAAWQGLSQSEDRL